MHNFKKLDIWIKSMDLASEIYLLTNSFPTIERFGLISQMQRSAVSVPSNIAEGSAKSSNKDFSRFLEMSIGSLFELETQLILATKLNYLESEVSISTQSKINELQKMIIGFKNKLD
ncbi:MAG: four helix bundle protein [Paludibacter sp.]|jgi:four helix bundle protein|nr:four helix bundle protein [Paludibacter sp.]